ncbi:MAG: spore germination protein [Clostridiales bacterium]|nr:spore germination protein [Clostridiales bacterium]
MGLFEPKWEEVPPHPRKEPRVEGPLTLERLAQVFEGCADYKTRPVLLGENGRRQATLCYLAGMVYLERVSDYVLRPLAQDKRLARCVTMEEVAQLLLCGAAYNLGVQERTTLDQAVFDLIDGCCLLVLPEQESVLSFSVPSEERRAVSQPENEPAIKGARDSFVEGLRTNTALIRRRLRTPSLKIEEHLVGRQSVTPVDVIWIDGIANPNTVKLVSERIAAIDIAALLSSSNLEEYITGDLSTGFPMLTHTERPDRFCVGLAEGRVGIVAEGLAMGYLLPATIQQFFKACQDKTNNWMVASALIMLRYLALLLSVFLPAVYIAAVTFHPEMIPNQMALSIITAKIDVPFTTVAEVLIILGAFEALQEASVLLPPSIGQSISILGGLVVGTAAVEAKIVSPTVLIVVAVAGISGYTIPNQDMAGAMRLWRFFLALTASAGGLVGIVSGVIVLVYRLARIESFGVAYLTPFAGNDGELVEEHALVRRPLPKAKLREKALRTRNKRNQK